MTDKELEMEERIEDLEKKVKRIKGSLSNHGVYIFIILIIALAS